MFMLMCQPVSMVCIHAHGGSRKQEMDSMIPTVESLLCDYSVEDPVLIPVLSAFPEMPMEDWCLLHG